MEHLQVELSQTCPCQCQGKDSEKQIRNSIPETTWLKIKEHKREFKNVQRSLQLYHVVQPEDSLEPQKEMQRVARARVHAVMISLISTGPVYSAETVTTPSDERVRSQVYLRRIEPMAQLSSAWFSQYVSYKLWIMQRYLTCHIVTLDLNRAFLSNPVSSNSNRLFMTCLSHFHVNTTN